MAGTIAGGKKAAETNIKKYGEDFYKKIGHIGGSNGTTGGFASGLLCDCDYTEDLHKKARCAGQKGGRVSRRGKAKPKTEPQKSLIKQIMEKIDVRLHQTK